MFARNGRGTEVSNWRLLVVFYVKNAGLLGLLFVLSVVLLVYEICDI